ncbi:SpvB/TcaC N-terminal domain-containing protein [Pendulispora albinea]|uniref:Toxin n=1 Tax=Pendulispora albinea TaxID=2741071 RepID=A0ABZ2M1I8_9BACT
MRDEEKKGAEPRAETTSPHDARSGGTAGAEPRGKDIVSVPAPPIPSLPKGGGALRGIGEKFAAAAATGTATMSVPIAISPGRNGMQPSIGLSYDSGGGNGPFGIGWSLSVPSIRRKTDKGLPLYADRSESDTFLLSGAEDLVPFLVEDAGGSWSRQVFTRDGMEVARYRPRVEGLFARIERWTNPTTGEVHWITVSKDNVTSLYGGSSQARIAHPDHPTQVFEWLLEATYDDRGNVVYYEYKQEDRANVPPEPFEQHRVAGPASPQRYLKRVHYGNRTPTLGSYLPLSKIIANTWLFEIVLDYGDHDAVAPTPAETTPWPYRKDPFSTYRASFEVRTYRLCRRVLMFHRFEELGPDPVLVRSTDFAYDEGPTVTYLRSVTQSGYLKKESAYEVASMPPLELDYQQPELHDRVELADPDTRRSLPGIIDGRTHRWVDLDGEGIAGLLSDEGGALFYRRNLGGAKLTRPRKLTTQPTTSALARGGQQLLDLESDGRLELVDFSGAVKGYSVRGADDRWHSFVPFKSLPNIDSNDRNVQFLDLNGDGFADILRTEGDRLVWYPSLGKDGFGAAVVIPLARDERKAPAVVFADAEQAIVVADMSGDGLSDIVRIRNGEVSYWPNLGYGRFGAKVTMARAPTFDKPGAFEPRRLRLFDVDGTGTTDIAYLGKNGVTLWFNQAGNQWSAARPLLQYLPTHDLASITVNDFLGTGTGTLVWFSSAPSDAPTRLRYIDLLGSKKPHVMIASRNNMGLQRKVAYATSTKFYLEDKANGVEWATRLAFPVHVIERVETYEAVTNTRLVTRYRYRHGFYDGPEREFRGFGLVEQFDAESYGTEGGPGLFLSGRNEIDTESHLPPIHTKTWFHTGAWKEHADIAAHFQKEYWAGDGAATVLPRTAFEGFIARDAVEEREAARALRGSVLRQEVYALDGGAKQRNPYTISERSYQVRRLQPADGAKHGVFLAHAREVVDYHYERNPLDPRVQHALTLEVDDYGTVLTAAAVGYPRRSSVSSAYPEQTRLLATVATNRVAHKDTETDWYRIGVPLEAASYELTGLDVPAGDQLLSFNAVASAVANAAEIPYEATPTPTAFQKRLLKKQRAIYYKDDLAGPLPFGGVESRALVHRSQGLTLTAGLVTSTYGARVTSDVLVVEGGYFAVAGDHWAPSAVPTYDAEHFYLVTKATEPFGNTSSVTYDAYSLLPIRANSSLTTPALDLVTLLANDYRVLQPWRVSDPNDNRAAVAFDALGMVIKTALMGKEGAGEGDTLEDPTTRFEYDLMAWKKGIGPVYSHGYAREEHGAANPRWQESYSYTAGHGREVLRKVQAEPEASGAPRWVGNGRTVFDNKGNPIKQYEPYFAPTGGYDAESDLAVSGVTSIFRYDALGRLIRTDFPNGTHSKVEFDSWHQASWDANDTVLDSAWYRSRVALPAGNPERRAAELTAAHANTPTVVHQDTLGRAFLTRADNGPKGIYDTRTALDIEGNVLKLTDARGNVALTQSYDLRGQAIRTVGAESGESVALFNIEGTAIRAWNSRNVTLRTAFDGVRRPTHVYVRVGAEAEFLAERTVYGEALPDSKPRNARGAIVRQYDSAGVVATLQRDFKGNTTEQRRRLALAYRTTADWSAIATLTDVAAIEAAAATLLNAEDFRTETTFDALNRATSATAPDGSVVKPKYNEANLLERVDVRVRGASTATPFVADVAYNAKGQRTSIVYSNRDFRTDYTYDPQTFRLTKQKTTRGSGGARLQDFSLTYDPVGNITQLDDDADASLYFSGAPPVAGGGKYTYEAIYRLATAEGREHPGQAMPSELDGPISSVPHPNDTQAMRRYSEQYEYDEVGNILEMVHAAGSSGTAGWTRRYQYAGESNKLLRTSLPGDPHAGPYSGIYEHDARGNMTKMPHLARIGWDYADRLQSAELGGGGKTYFVYDSSGQRVRKVWEKTATLRDERIYLGGYEIFRRSVGESVETERQTLHVMDDRRRVAMVETETVANAAPVANPVSRMRYQLGNQLDSACVEVTETGGIISYEEYHPFGTTSFHSADGALGVSAKRYRYTGKERDEETGLYDHGARYYAAWLGRWTSVDRKFSDGDNLFAYVRNNPIGRADPDGNQSVPVTVLEEKEQKSIPSEHEASYQESSSSGETSAQPTAAPRPAETKASPSEAARPNSRGPNTQGSASPPEGVYETKYSPIPLMRSRDTGSRALNFLLNDIFLPWRNTLAAAENTPFEILGTIDEELKNSRFQMEYQAAQDLMPLGRLHGIALEAPGALSYLSAHLSANIERFARSLPIIGVGAGGIGGGGRLGPKIPAAGQQLSEPVAAAAEEMVTLYHGHQVPLEGGKFSLEVAAALKRAGTPEPGIYFTTDIVRAATQYGGVGGYVTRTQVPRSIAEMMMQASPLPGVRRQVQYEWVARTFEQVDALNAAIETLPQMEALKAWLGLK